MPPLLPSERYTYDEPKYEDLYALGDNLAKLVVLIDVEPTSFVFTLDQQYPAKPLLYPEYHPVALFSPQENQS